MSSAFYVQYPFRRFPGRLPPEPGQRHPSDTSLDDFAVNDVENRDNDGRQTVTPTCCRVVVAKATATRLINERHTLCSPFVIPKLQLSFQFQLAAWRSG